MAPLIKISCILACSVAPFASANWWHGHGGGGMRGKGRGKGMMGRGGGGGGGGGGWGWGGGGGGRGDEMETIHKLLENHEKIFRDKNETEAGIVARTWSGDEDVADWIIEHVHQMKSLMDSDHGKIRSWDPLFDLAFDLRDFNDITITDDGDGVTVIHEVVDGLDDDEEECAVAIIQEHANVVGEFVRLGFDEAHDSHAIPTECAAFA